MRLVVIDLDWLERGAVSLAADNDPNTDLDPESRELIKLTMIKLTEHIIKSTKSIVPHIDKAFYAGVLKAESILVENNGSPDLETYKKINNYVDV